MIDKIDLIEFDKIALSKSEAKALKLLQTSNLLLNGESKKRTRQAASSWSGRKIPYKI